MSLHSCLPPQSTTTRFLRSRGKEGHTLGGTGFLLAFRTTATVCSNTRTLQWLRCLCVTPDPRPVGRKTFPRARRTQVHGFRSPVSFSPTEQSPSTSSGSSVFTPDLEEVPGPSRRPRRGSDIEPTPTPNPAVPPTLSVMDISPPSRCE